MSHVLAARKARAGGRVHAETMVTNHVEAAWLVAEVGKAIVSRRGRSPETACPP